MVAASAARNGHTVLHVDVNDYYGGLWSAFNFDGMQKWIELNGKYEDAKCNDKDNEISIESNANAAQDEQNIDSLLKDGEILVKYIVTSLPCMLATYLTLGFPIICS